MQYEEEDFDGMGDEGKELVRIDLVDVMQDGSIESAIKHYMTMHDVDTPIDLVTGRYEDPEQPNGWSSISCVNILPPDNDDCLDHPEAVAKLAVAVYDYHSHFSDTKRWEEIVKRMKRAGEAVKNVDFDMVDID